MSGPSQFQQFYQSDQHGRYLDITHLNPLLLSSNEHQAKAGYTAHFYYPGKYLIYDSGELFSIGLGKFAIGSLDSKGYLRFRLRGSHRLEERIHRLVALAFVDGYSDREFHVNHIDENKQNNGYLNLEWCTPQYNYSYGTDLSRRDSSSRTHRCCCSRV